MNLSLEEWFIYFLGIHISNDLNLEISKMPRRRFARYLSSQNDGRIYPSYKEACTSQV